MSQVPFINRVPELQQMDEFIDLARTWNTRYVICIQGDAGVGKTRLLQEMGNRYPVTDFPRLMIPDLIDFDETELHDFRQVDLRITQSLRVDFAPHRRLFQDLLRMQAARFSPESIASQKQEVTDAFVESFNRFSAKRRVVLRFDTTDALGQGPPADLISYLQTYLPVLTNVVIVLAGRNASEIWQVLAPGIDDEGTLIELKPLGIDASVEYLETKTAQLHITLSNEILQKLLRLSQGLPILLDLGVEWLARNRPPEWFRSFSSDELQSMSSEEIQELREKFEKQIIGQVADFSTPRDRIIAVLAHVYPLDEEAIPEIAEVPPFEAVEALSELKTFMFVKTLPGRRIKLHDYAQELVEKYVWPLEEARGGSRVAVSQTSLSYLAPRIEKLQSRISTLQQRMESEYPDAIDDLMLERDELEYRLLAVLQHQCLEQLSYVDPLKAFDLFQQLIKQADRAYRPTLKSDYVHIMRRKRVRARLNHNQLYELGLEYCKALAVAEEYEKALEVAKEELLPLVGTSPERSIEVALQTGRWYVRLGQIEQGLSLFQEAVESSRHHNFLKLQVEAEELTGWAHRLLCEWEEARTHYFNALALNAEIGNPLQEASLLINLAFVQSYLNRDVASRLCLQAIERLERIQNRLGLGRAYSTQGCVNYQMGRLEDALIAFGRSLEIFEPAGDRQWISTVYSWRGATYWSLAHHARVANRVVEAEESLAQAERDLEYALSIGIPKDKPMTLHRLARVYLDRGRTQEAKELLEQCYDQSQAIPDIWYQIASLRGLARVAVYGREFERIREFEEKTREYTTRWTWKGRPLGGMYLQLGNLALGNDWVEVAVSYYQEGLELIALDQSYGGLDFGYYVRELEEMIASLTTPETLKMIGTQLIEFWKMDPVLCNKHPEAVVLFSDWRAQ